MNNEKPEVMDKEEQKEEKIDGRDTGKLFVSRLGMVGCAMFIIMLAGYLLVCFSAGSKSPIDGYEPPASSEYYMENPNELANEINENIMPQLEGIAECYCEDDKVVVVAENAEYFTVRSALLDYYREELFDFRKDTSDE